ncbi:MAG: class I SAM-dependent methyltransferase [Candidatus Omnitrophica bacterium]|nr:class I SAM-dependent methyltransferase [Candidatus Omnitrophota bacterium]
MATSNWQNISLCCELIERIRPRSVLDVGCGFGRWGFLSREYLDIWKGRTHEDKWETRIDAVEVFEPYIKPSHRYIYDDIFIGNVLDVLPDLANYDLIIIGDMLEHLEKSQGKKLLELVQQKANKAVLLTVPLGDSWPQEERDENEWEGHKSAWKVNEFKKRGAKTFLFWDNTDRPFGVVLFDFEGKNFYQDSWRHRVKVAFKHFAHRLKGF